MSRRYHHITESDKLRFKTRIDENLTEVEDIVHMYVTQYRKKIDNLPRPIPKDAAFLKESFLHAYHAFLDEFIEFQRHIFRKLKYLRYEEEKDAINETFESFRDIRCHSAYNKFRQLLSRLGKTT